MVKKTRYKSARVMDFLNKYEKYIIQHNITKYKVMELVGQYDKQEEIIKNYSDNYTKPMIKAFEKLTPKEQKFCLEEIKAVLIKE